MDSYPKKFNKFILLEKIASGGMAEIFLAQTVGPGGFEKFVALKRILPVHGLNPEFLSMFIDEAKVTSQLTHGNIVQIYEFGQSDENYYLSMEYVEGKNLRQIISKAQEVKKPIPIEHAVYIVNQVCEGLDYAHRFKDKKAGSTLHIIHRDISPQNILISYEGEIKLIDFGIAKTRTQGDKTKSGILKGKFGYMSPEQANGEPLDQRTDIFSAGIILFEMLTGQRLFAGSNDLASLKKIQEAKIPTPSTFNPEIPMELETMVLKALSKDPISRYQTAQEFHRDLSRFLHTVNPGFTSHHLALFNRSLFALEIINHKKYMNEILAKLSQMGYSPPYEAPLVKRKEKSSTKNISQEKTYHGMQAPKASSQDDYQKKTWVQIIAMGMIIVILSVMLLYLNRRADRMIQSESPNAPSAAQNILTKPSHIVKEILVPTHEGHGFLTIKTDIGNEIYIDGKRIEKKPVTKLKLSEGQHHVRAINTELNLSAEETIEITLDEDTLVDEKNLVFKPIPQY